MEHQQKPMTKRWAKWHTAPVSCNSPLKSLIKTSFAGEGMVTAWTGGMHLTQTFLGFKATTGPTLIGWFNAVAEQSSVQAVSREPWRKPDLPPKSQYNSWESHIFFQAWCNVLMWSFCFATGLSLKRVPLLVALANQSAMSVQQITAANWYYSNSTLYSCVYSYT